MSRFLPAPRHTFPFLLAFLPRAAAATGPEPGAAAKANVPTEVEGSRSQVQVKVEGAALSFTPRRLPKAKQSARGEMSMIERAEAVLQVEHPLAAGKAQLPAGTYALQVEVEDGKSWFLVLSRAAAEGSPKVDPAPASPEAKPDAPAPTRRKKAAQPASKRTAAPSRTIYALEKMEEMHEGAAEEGPPAPAAEKDAKTPAKPRKRAPKRTGEPGARVAAPATGERARIPLKLAACEKTGNDLVFELKPSAKGSKLRVVVRAGGTEGKALLKFAKTP